MTSIRDRVRYHLEVGGVRVAVDPNPYSPAGDVPGRVAHVRRLSELEELDADSGTARVLTDELVREQVLPTVSVFLSLPAHVVVDAWWTRPSRPASMKSREPCSPRHGWPASAP